MIITTDHTTVDYQRVVELAPRILDTRNASKNTMHDGRVTLL